MMSLFRQGAFQGIDAGQGVLREVRRRDDDARTIATSGIVNIEVGFAPLKPAEFVVIKIQQIAGDSVVARRTHHGEPDSSVNAHRIDPYKNFKFRVAVGRQAGAGREQGQPAQAHDRGGASTAAAARTATTTSRPAARSYEAITLERGITHDLEFEKWANMVHPYAGDAAMDLVNYKKELTLEVMNEKGQVGAALLPAPLLGERVHRGARPRRQRQRVAIEIAQARARGLGARSSTPSSRTRRRPQSRGDGAAWSRPTARTTPTARAGRSACSRATSTSTSMPATARRWPPPCWRRALAPDGAPLGRTCGAGRVGARLGAARVGRRLPGRRELSWVLLGRRAAARSSAAARARSASARRGRRGGRAARSDGTAVECARPTGADRVAWQALPAGERLTDPHRRRGDRRRVEGPADELAAACRDRGARSTRPIRSWTRRFDVGVPGMRSGGRARLRPRGRAARARATRRTSCSTTSLRWPAPSTGASTTILALPAGAGAATWRRIE